jgi:hypothetical protein
MEGKREFINKSCFDITVVLTVRAGEKPGCCLRKEEFCLKCSECKTICFGSEANPFLDEIHVCSHSHSQCTETKLAVLKCGSAVDKLFNTHHHIVFLSAGQTIVISGH